MARLIEVRSEESVPPSLKLKVGDLLSFAATGGHVRSGADVVEILGPFTSGVIVDASEILSPAGGPGVVMFLARHTGQAQIEVVTGDPWHASRTTKLEIIVES